MAGTGLLERITSRFASGEVPADVSRQDAERIVLRAMYARGRFLENIQDYNPDVLISRKRYDIIDEMLRDDQVKAAMNLKMKTPISGGYVITPGSDDKAHEEHAQFIRDNFSKMVGSFEKHLQNINLALPYGFSIQEKVFKEIDGGHWRGKWALDKLLPAAPHNITWDIEDDEVVGIKQQGGTNKTVYNWKIVRYTWQERWSNPWGITDLEAAYRFWFSKDFALRHWNIHLERYALKRLSVTYKDPNHKSLAEAFVDDFAEIIGFAAPEGMEIELLGGDERGGVSDAYSSAIGSHDTAIARSILKQTLTMNQGERVGSMALGRVHENTMVMDLETVQDDLEGDVVGEQIIKPLIDINFGPQDAYPEIKLGAILPDDPKEALETFLEWMKEGGAIVTQADEDFMRSTLEMPERKEGPPPPGPSDQKEDEEVGEVEEFETGEEKIDFARRSESERRQDAKAIEADLDQKEASTLEGLVGTVVKIRGKILGDVEKRFFKDGLANATQVNNIHVPFLREFRQILHDGGLEAAQQGRLDLIKAMQAAKSEEIQNAANKVRAAAVNPGGMKFEEQLRAFKQHWSARATGVATEFGQEVESGIRNILLNALRNGETQAATQQKLEALFEKYLPGSTQAGGAVSPWRLENIIRTNFTSAYNQSRLIQSRDPALEGFIQGYIYSAILDQRTTDICIGLEGTKLAKNDPRVDTILPPNHFMCRSILVEALIDESFAPTESKTVNSRMDEIQEGFA